MIYMLVSFVIGGLGLLLVLFVVVGYGRTLTNSDVLLLALMCLLVPIAIGVWRAADLLEKLLDKR